MLEKQRFDTDSVWYPPKKKNKRTLLCLFFLEFFSILSFSLFFAFVLGFFLGTFISKSNKLVPSMFCSPHLPSPVSRCCQFQNYIEIHSSKAAAAAVVASAQKVLGWSISFTWKVMNKWKSDYYRCSVRWLFRYSFSPFLIVILFCIIFYTT